MDAREEVLIQPPVFQIRRLMLKGTLVLSVLLGVVVYAARSPQSYVCLQLTNGYGGSAQQFDLVDLQSGQDTLDTRAGQSPFGITSPDGQYVAALQVSKPGSSVNNLVIQYIGEGSTEIIPVQSGIVSGTWGYYRFGSLRWSPDSKRLAYIWTGADQQTHLSTVNVDGSGLATALLPDMGNGTVIRQISWSADAAYLSLGETVNRSDFTYSFWSASDLQRIDTNRRITVRAVAWSPQDHRLAAVWEDVDSTRHLTLWSLPDQTVDTSFVMPPDKMVGQIVWSPNGQYVVLQSHRQCAAAEGCMERLNYDVLSRDGKLIAADIAGETSISSNQNYFVGAPPVFTWTTDGTTLVFLQENPKEALDDLVALHVPSNQYEIIAHNVVSDLAHDMFYLAFPFRRQAFFRTTVTPLSKRVVLPIWDNGKINVDLADIDGSSRVTLVQGADEVLDSRPGSAGYSSRFWTANGRIAVVVWATRDAAENTRQVHLTWAQSDGSGKHEIADGLESVSLVQLVEGMNQQWLGYVAQRNGTIGVELANIDTGEYYRLLDDQESIYQWALTLSPVGNLAALQLGISTGRLYGENTLFLTSLDGTWIRQVSTEAIGIAYWSPDGSKLAFLHHESSGSNSYAQVVSANGLPVTNIPIRQASTSSPRLYKWSQCS